jgi:glutamyl-tRNA reductase
MSDPQVFVIGTNHHATPLEVREKLALSAEAAAAIHSELAAVPGLRELAVLNTCNRVEFYGVAWTASAMGAVESLFCARQRFDPGDFEKFRVVRSGRAAVQHLFEVATGLDSQIVGETEILGQVKEAYAAAQARGSTGPILNRLFQKAFQAAKHARTNTGIGSGQVSVANVAVDLALNIFGTLESRSILLLGIGEIGEKTARAFRSRGAGKMAVVSRRVERARELAAELGAGALAFEEREERLAEFDVVVSSAAAPGTVWSSAATAAAMRRRPARPLFFIDLALPRNVEVAVADLENVFLYNLDDLGKLAEENRLAREAEILRCRALLGERSDALWERIGPLLADCHAPAGANNRPPDAAKGVSRDAAQASPPRSPPPAG